MELEPLRIGDAIKYQGILVMVVKIDEEGRIFAHSPTMQLVFTDEAYIDRV